MAVTEEFLRMWFEVKGEEALAPTAADLKKVSEATYELAGAAQKAGAYELVPSVLDKVAPAAKRAEASLTAAAEASTKFGAQSEKAVNKVANLGQQGRVTGIIVQDFVQGGIGGIVNNIDQAVSAFGGTAGLAGALTVAGAAFLVLKPIITTVIKELDLFGAGVDKTKSSLGQLEDEIKILEEKPHKIVLEVLKLEEGKREIEEMKKGLQDTEALRRSQTTAEAEAGAALGKAMEALGGKNLESKLREQMTKDISATDKIMNQTEKQLRYYQSLQDQGVTMIEDEKVGDIINEKLTILHNRFIQISKIGGEADLALGKLTAAAKKAGGEEQVAAQKELAEVLRRLREDALADQIESFTAEEIAEDRAAEAEEKREEERLALRKKMRQSQIAVDEKAAQIEADIIKEQIDKEWELILQQRKFAEEAAKIANDRAEAEIRAAQRVEDHERAREDKKLGKVMKRVTAGTIDEQAAVVAAQLRATGAAPEEQQAELQTQIVNELKRQERAGIIPKLSAEERGGAARKIAGQAFEGVDEQMGAIASVTGDNQLALFQVMQAMNQRLAQTEIQLRGVGGVIRDGAAQFRNGQDFIGAR